MVCRGLSETAVPPVRPTVHQCPSETAAHQGRPTGPDLSEKAAHRALLMARRPPWEKEVRRGRLMVRPVRVVCRVQVPLPATEARPVLRRGQGQTFRARQTCRGRPRAKADAASSAA